MFGRKHKPDESITLYHFEAESSDELTDGQTTKTTANTGRHCAWCGDPPDVHGSHGICGPHSAQVAAEAAARRERLRRSRGQL